MPKPAQSTPDSYRDPVDRSTPTDMLGRPQPAAVAEPEGVTRHAVLRMLRRRWLTVALCGFGGACGALALSLSEEKEYESSASVLFRPANLEPGLFDSRSSSSVDAERAAATNVELGDVDVVAERAAARLRTPGVSGPFVGAKVHLSSESESDIASVTARTTDPVLSRRMANAFAQEYIAFRRKLDRARVREARKLLARQLERLTVIQQATPEGRTLRRAAEELQAVGVLRTGSAELVQRARANDVPVAPLPKRSMAAGLMLGLLLGIAVAFLRELRDRRLDDEADVDRALGLPILASIPGTGPIRRAGSRREGTAPLPEAEAFRMLRANLHHVKVDREVRSLLVTSAVSGEGKSTVAWNLALAEAQAGREVLLIEANLRAGALAERLKLPNDSGLSLFLAGEASLGECSLTVTTSAYRLDVLPAGPTPSNPAQLLESARMASLLESAESRYDVVVVDSPPALVVADAIPLLRQVSGVMVVVRLGHSTSDLAEELRDRLQKLGAPVLGAVVNDARQAR